MKACKKGREGKLKTSWVDSLIAPEDPEIRIDTTKLPASERENNHMIFDNNQQRHHAAKLGRLESHTAICQIIIRNVVGGARRRNSQRKGLHYGLDVRDYDGKTL